MLDSSREIIDRAIKDIKPYATVLALSGGNDSLTAYHTAKALDVPLDFILHVNTRTGIQETTEYVRGLAESEGVRYVEADAGDSYEKYVLNHGFFGRGKKAHEFSYHLLKADHIRHAISKHIRQGKRNRPVIILSGARIQESDNRSQNFSAGPVDRERKTQNYWVKPLHYWSKLDCMSFLDGCGAKRNPVTQKLCRSGECLCGTMQSEQVRQEASFWYPSWGRWLDELEQRVLQRFPWRWGQDVPKTWHVEQLGQQRFPEFQPMCTSCVASEDAPLKVKIGGKVIEIAA